MRERLEENCAEIEIGGTLCLERFCGNNLLGERLWEHCLEREIGVTLY